MGSTTFTGGDVFVSLPCCRCKKLKVIGKGSGKDYLKNFLLSPSIQAVYVCFVDIDRCNISEQDIIHNKNKYVVAQRIVDSLGSEILIFPKGEKVVNEGCVEGVF